MKTEGGLLLPERFAKRSLISSIGQPGAGWLSTSATARYRALLLRRLTLTRSRCNYSRAVVKKVSKARELAKQFDLSKARDKGNGVHEQEVDGSE